MKDISSQPEIVQRAYMEGVTNIGQLSKQELKDLNKAVKDGVLQILTDFRYPSPKKRYVINFDDLITLSKAERH